MRRARAREEVEPGVAHLVAHELGVAAGGAELHAVLLWEGCARQLADELEDPPLAVAEPAAVNPLLQLASALRERLPISYPGCAPHELAEEVEW